MSRKIFRRILLCLFLLAVACFVVATSAIAQPSTQDVRAEPRKLWDIATGREIRTFEEPSGNAGSVAFSPDGRVVLAGSDDGSIRLWDKATGQILTTSVSYPDGSWLTITPEGFFDGSSPETTENFSVVRGIDICAPDRVYSALYRPDLVREKMAGDPDGKVKAAAAQLDLDKVCFDTNSEQNQQRRTEAGQRPQ